MSALRKILNLPEKEPGGGEEEKTAAGSGSEFDSGSEESGHRHAARHGLGWAEEEETSGRSFARRAGRVVIWSVIALAAFTGVRTWVFPAKTPPPAVQSDPQAEARKNDVPVQEAQQVAARFARSYMNLNSRDKDARAGELEADLVKGVDPKLGWDGSGMQLVAQTIPGAVTQTGGHRARVSVDVRVSVTTTVKGKAATSSSWRALEVPVAEAGGRVVVTGQPALVGRPSAVSYDAPEGPEADSGMSNATREVVSDFLTAWAAGKAEQASAPGAHIEPLGSGMSVDALDSWLVDAGTGDRRTGTAVVRWALAGAQLQQTYQITLTKVSAGGASRWQVDTVSAKSA
ncbi:conjugal transfer protein [Streptomyces anulatus]|uniref:conjugal transfer protein n=1 Tax=Streptomyces anulatus TaxID=1892 RepID=UPI001C2720AC|nr:conjugal transfer protein [Streptomyces anulatus]